MYTIDAGSFPGLAINLPSETESLDKYKATLGHKSNHSFRNNAVFNPNQLSPGQKCPGVNFFFNALFVSEHFKHFEIYLFLAHFGG